MDMEKTGSATDATARLTQRLGIGRILLAGTVAGALLAWAKVRWSAVDGVASGLAVISVVIIMIVWAARARGVGAMRTGAACLFAVAVIAVTAWIGTAGLVAVTVDRTRDGSGGAAQANAPSFHQVAGAGRTLIMACHLYAAEHNGRLPPDLVSAILADPDLPGTDPTLRDALVPADVDRARLTAMTAEERAHFAGGHAAFEYFGRDVHKDTPGSGVIIVIAGQDHVSNPRDDTGVQTDARFVGYADGHGEWVPRANWPATWQRSEAARVAAGLPVTARPSAATRSSSP